VSNDIYEADGKKYLVYSYSRGDDGSRCSYLCVLDISDNSDVKEIYKSQPFFSEYDISFAINAKSTPDGYVVTDENGDWVADNKIRVSYMKWEEFEGGGYGSESMNYTGWLIYENGGFYYEIDENQENW
jgi:hypothetical protein